MYNIKFMVTAQLLRYCDFKFLVIAQCKYIPVLKEVVQYYSNHGGNAFLT